MGIRCIALDLDGTVLNSEKEVSGPVWEALERAAEKGIILVLASGRPGNSFPRQLESLKGVKYRITGNGCGVYDGNGRELLRKRLSGPCTDQILALALQEGFQIEAVLDGKPYADLAYVSDPERFGVSARGAAYVRETREPVADMADFVRKHREKLDCINLILKPEKKEKAAERLRREIDGVYVTSSSKMMLEVSDLNCGKAQALAWILKREEIDPGACAAFGDGENDVQMLKSCGWGIAMGNAEESCKEAAVYVTEDHNRDGVAQGINWLWENAGL